VGIAVLALVAGGCESDDGGGGGREDLEKPFAPNIETSEVAFSFLGPDGTKRTLDGGLLDGTRVVGDRSWPRWGMESPGESPPRGGEAWIEWEGEEIEAAGGQVFYPESGLTSTAEPFFVIELDPPVKVALDPPVGVPQEHHFVGSAWVGGMTAPEEVIPIDVVGTLTLTETDASVETSMGTVSGCRVFQGNAAILGQALQGMGWYHPEMGLVYATLDYPPPDGLAIDVAAIFDYGTPKGGWNTVAGSKTITAADPYFQLTTHGRAGEFDADKDTHAKMLLEYRWAEPDKAVTDTEPAVFVEFGTTFGYYPHLAVPSPISFFHPEDNGKGYTFWIAYVDQAAKNEAENGISYRIDTTLADYATGSVKVTARLHYKLYP
jgi:hypothetical protein